MKRESHGYAAEPRRIDGHKPLLRRRYFKLPIALVAVLSANIQINRQAAKTAKEREANPIGLRDLSR